LRFRRRCRWTSCPNAAAAAVAGRMAEWRNVLNVTPPPPIRAPEAAECVARDLLGISDLSAHTSAGQMAGRTCNIADGRRRRKTDHLTPFKKQSQVYKRTRNTRRSSADTSAGRRADSAQTRRRARLSVSGGQRAAAAGRRRAAAADSVKQSHGSFCHVQKHPRELPRRSGG